MKYQNQSSLLRIFKSKNFNRRSFVDFKDTQRKPKMMPDIQ